MRLQLLACVVARAPIRGATVGGRARIEQYHLTWMRTDISILLLLFVLVLSGTAGATLSGAEERTGEDTPHGEISVPCASCHNQESWTELRSPLDFDHSTTGFQLLRGHEELTCRSCHESLDFSTVPGTCADCHEDPHSGDLGASCESCHTADSWDNRRQIFDLHSTTLFPLTGSHATTDCASCHRQEPPFEFSSTPTDCVSCHAAEYEASTRPNHLRVGFSTDCQECHTTNAWQDSRFAGGPGFDHSIFFALAGAHRTLSCGSCHQGEVFAGTPRDCFSCHQSDFDATVAPPHAQSGLPTTCESCHEESGWEGATLDHDPFFELAGAHRALDCESCHIDGRYQGTPRDCFSCHQADYEATANPNHPAAGFSTSCESCHSEASWEGATFDHDTVFELLGAHRTVDCAACHVGEVYSGTPTDCVSCHRSDFDATTDPNHALAGFPTACDSCHTEATWEGATFDHDEFFALAGAHRGADCASCHVDGLFAGTPRDCVSCHRSDYDATADPNHALAGFPTACDSCHTEASWEGATFDHDEFFVLAGAHRGADCASCHVDGLFAGTPRDCVSCHRSDYDATTDPDHAASGFATSCEDCHGQTSWEGAAFDHNAVFELLGAHATADCTSCHVGDRYAGTPRDCFSCHAEEYESTSDPNHRSAGFSTSCEDCHDSLDWKNAAVDHDEFFALTGGHRQLACLACHADGYEGTPTDCFSCHANDYNATEDPNHSAAGFPTDCESCHDTTSWNNATFDHDSWALTGSHATTSCASCHADGFEGTPTDCFSCHAEDYDRTTDPNHREAGFPVTCEDCHDTSNWGGADFDHDELFELTGGHAGLECASCHADGFEDTPTDCYACHADDYDRTTEPDHREAGFPTSCEDCHTIANWNADLDHDAFFPLTGAHRALECESCHADGYDGTPTDCYSCHVNDYNGTEDPNHTDAGFPTTCEDCHTTSNWDATFDHDAFYPLTGAHRPLECESCHADGYDGTPTDCYSCHVNDYNGTEDPNHSAAGFPTTCEDCHTTSDWNATFDHDAFYPLTGRHRPLSCESCHADGYDGTPTDCFACHSDDYDRTTDPNHRSAGFPTSCEECHTTSDWDDATFDHDGLYFPIYSGKHEDEWDQCTDCHVVPNNFAVFECIQCHEHRKSEADDEHEDVPGYVYESQSCYACHPDGSD